MSDENFSDRISVPAQNIIPWYRHQDFSLLPTIEYRKGDEHNTDAYSFRWLIFHAWTMDHTDLTFDFGVNLTFRPRIFVGAVVPYLRLMMIVPLPKFFDAYRWGLYRKSPYKKKEAVE